MLEYIFNWIELIELNKKSIKNSDDLFLIYEQKNTLEVIELDPYFMENKSYIVTGNGDVPYV